ncbi:YlmH/Sll1252 family protein [Caloramator sp. mosi_1]|nr:YlmH/Sll1252 family protein [Caloramator sp. mosi_1]WDC85882.1 YlmH/Sll1252 family protein [Caloramator sp. mosi_1]
MDIIKVNGNFKFEKLSHRDYLGALLSLGIKREKIGDINVFDDGAEIYVSKELSDYIVFNLNKIKHTGIKLEKITFEEARERVQFFKEIVVNAASLRIDAVISEVYNLSRSEASSLIKQGNVKINYISNDDQSYKLNDGDIVSVKGFGRFIFSSVIRNTKSQRLVLSIKNTYKGGIIMTITPNEIINKEFKKVLRGYDVDEVEDF